jgi:tetratricopeptide (TPR) repeat protein
MASYRELLEKGDKQLLEFKDYSEAENLYKEAMALKPNGVDVINALIVWKKLMKADVDEDLFKKALQAVDKYPKHFLTLFNISLIYLERTSYEKAHDFLMRAYKIQNSNQQLLYNLAFWKQKLKDYKGNQDLVIYRGHQIVWKSCWKRSKPSQGNHSFSHLTALYWGDREGSQTH